MHKRVSGTGGLARIHVILAVLIIILAVIISIPAYREYKYHADWLLCADSLRVVNGALTVDFLENDLQSKKLADAENSLVAILPGRDDYCPAGGTVYMLQQDNGTWKAVCGAHDSDHALRTRLNGVYVLSCLRDEIARASLDGTAPEEITVQLNGRDLRCRLVDADPGIRRGTRTTRGYSGTVVFYGISGRGSFDGESSSDREEGMEICFFCFADEDHNANWSASDGWPGSAYGDRY